MWNDHSRFLLEPRLSINISILSRPIQLYLALISDGCMQNFRTGGQPLPGEFGWGLLFLLFLPRIYIKVKSNPRCCQVWHKRKGIKQSTLLAKIHHKMLHKKLDPHRHSILMIRTEFLQIREQKFYDLRENPISWPQNISLTAKLECIEMCNLLSIFDNRPVK